MCLYPTDALEPSDALVPACDPAVPQHILRVSFDDPGTAEASRTYVPFESRLRSWDVNGGRDDEISDFDATSAVYVLDNRDRELDPTNADSTYYPDLVPNRLLWHRVDVDGALYDVFKGYVDGWGPEWDEHGVGDQRARVRCSDGKKLLRLATFTAADPDVLDYEDVISADEPIFYYRLGEPSGTKLVHHVRKKRKRRKGESRKHYKRHGFRRWTTSETRPEAEGTSGPAGTYKNTPSLGEPGGIAGDPSTSVRFTRANSEYARVLLEDAEDLAPALFDISFEAWVYPVSLASGVGNRNVVIAAPMNSTLSFPTVWLYLTSTSCEFEVPGLLDETAATASALPLNQWSHIAGTRDVTTGVVKIYVNGVAGSDGSSSAAFTPNDSTNYLYIGSSNLNLANNAFDGRIQDAAVYQSALSADRVQAHYEAGLLGFDSNTTGGRILDALDLAGTVPAASVPTGVRSMPPARYAGVAPLDIIDDAVAAEGEPALFFFSADGTPTFLASDYRDSIPFSSPSQTFGGSGVEFEDAGISDSDSFLYNDVRGTREDGESTFRAEDATSIGRFGRLTLSLDSLPIADDADTQSYVDDLLDRYKDPLIRVPSFKLSSGHPDETTAEAKRAAMFSLGLADCVSVSVPLPGGGDPLTQTSYIERRHLYQDQGSTVIRAEFSISPR